MAYYYIYNKNISYLYNKSFLICTLIEYIFSSQILTSIFLISSFKDVIEMLNYDEYELEELKNIELDIIDEKIYSIKVPIKKDLLYKE
jgi:hypothetical protein